MTSGWVKVALAVSLALNLFFVGLALGAVGMRARLTAQQEVRPGGNPLMLAADALPVGVRAAYRERIREQGRTAQDALIEARQARMEAARLMAAAEFDPQATLAALERAREAEGRARGDLETTVVEFAHGLPRAQRLVLAGALREPPGAARPGRGGRGGPGGRGFGGPEGPPPIEP